MIKRIKQWWTLVLLKREAKHFYTKDLPLLFQYGTVQQLKQFAENCKIAGKEIPKLLEVGERIENNAEYIVLSRKRSWR